MLLLLLWWFCVLLFLSCDKGTTSVRAIVLPPVVNLYMYVLLRVMFVLWRRGWEDRLPQQLQPNVLWNSLRNLPKTKHNIRIFLNIKLFFNTFRTYQTRIEVFYSIKDHLSRHPKDQKKIPDFTSFYSFLR